MSKILNFHNQGGTYNDNSESIITISPEGTRVEQHTHTADTKVNGGKRTGGMSIGQQVLLFSELLDTSMDSTYVNIAQLADFIAQVTNGKPEPIRQKIMEISKMKEYGKQIKADAEKVAKLIEPYKPEIASELRSVYTDD